MIFFTVSNSGPQCIVHQFLATNTIVIIRISVVNISILILFRLCNKHNLLLILNSTI